KNTVASSANALLKFFQSKFENAVKNDWVAAATSRESFGCALTDPTGINNTKSATNLKGFMTSGFVLMVAMSARFGLWEKRLNYTKSVVFLDYLFSVRNLSTTYSADLSDWKIIKGKSVAIFRPASVL